MTPIQAGGLAAVFKVLANDTRLRLMHALVRADEMCVTDLDFCCTPKPALKERPLMTPIQAGGLAAVFKVLANDTRKPSRTSFNGCLTWASWLAGGTARASFTAWWIPA